MGANRGDRRAALGLAGESLAARHLERMGYRVIARRWRCTTGELDLIVRDAATLVFVEVRTRWGMRHGAAVESITAAKQARLVELAGLYLEAHPEVADHDWRIDVVAVQLDERGRLVALEHIPGAIEA